MRHGIEHPVVNDADFKVWQSYAVKAWPTVVLVDPQGKVVHTQAGEILAEEFAPMIEALIAEAEAKGTLNRAALEVRPERMVEPARPLNYPSKLLWGAERRLFIADTGHHRILEVALDEAGLKGDIRRVFGSGRPGLKDGPAVEAMFHDPHGMALNGKTLYVADTENHAIRAIELESGQVRTVAGTGQKAHGSYNLGRPTETPLRSPWALLATDDILFIAMAGSHQIWVLLQEEQLGPFFGNGREALVDGGQMEASFNQPSDLAMGMGHIFLADAEASAIRAISLAEKPQVMTLIGEGLFEFGDVDGFGGMVRLQHPTGLTYADGLVYIADSYNHKIKTLDPTTGEVKSLIGSGRPGQADGAFGEAELYEPEGVIAAERRLYIADTNNHMVRVADLENKRVETLMLRGLERLQPVMPAEEEHSPDRRYDPLVVRPGQVTLYLDIELPEGYKLNPEAPVMLRVVQNGSSTAHTFEPGQVPRLTLDINANQELTFDLTLYYCETEEERLCLIHSTRLGLPFEIAEGGPAVVRTPYQAPVEA